MKVVGNWKGWESKEKPLTKEQVNLGRRRVYVFALCNAAQIFSAYAVAWLMGTVSLK